MGIPCVSVFRFSLTFLFFVFGDASKNKTSNQVRWLLLTLCKKDENKYNQTQQVTAIPLDCDQSSCSVDFK